MASRWIKVAASDGKSFEAFVATPPVTPGPGILLIQEIFGINAHIRAVAEQYAGDGFVVIAPDLFWRSQARIELGYGDADFKKGFELLTALNFEQTVQDLVDSATTLRALPEFKGALTSLGYCAGGLLSYLVAATGTVDASICYYGAGISDRLALAPKVTRPILFHFAGNDKYIASPAVEAVKRAFAGRKDAAVHLYPGVDHGFNCWARAAYNQHAALLAHGRSLEFLAGL